MKDKKECKKAYQIFYGTCPDMDVAKEIARALLDASLVACVNLLPNMTSLYHWQGVVEMDSEVVFIAKSSEAHWQAASELFASLHPYDEPALVALDLQSGLAGYLGWMDQELGPVPQSN